MTVGVLQLILFIPQANSLKSKRHLLKSLKDTLRHKFNVSVAEVEGLDKWQRAHLAVVSVHNDRRFLNSLLSQAVNLVEHQRSLELIDYKIEFC